MNTNTKPQIEVVRNTSGMSDRQVEHKVREHQWRDGLHAVLIQNRYGDGDFFVDWQPIANVDEASSPDWNVVVSVAENYSPAVAGS